MTIRFYVALACFLLPVAATRAQSTFPPDSLVVKLFREPDTVQWIRRFYGRFDDVHSVKVLLGYDGNHCRGFMVLNQSKKVIRLEGTLDGPLLRIQERDDANQPAAFWKGIYKDQTITAEWINHNNTLGSVIRLDEVGPDYIITDNCADNKWMNRYVGDYKKQPVQLSLQRLYDGLVLAHLWVAADSIDMGFKGAIDEEGKYTLESEPLPGAPQQWLEGQPRNDQNTRCTWTSSDGAMRVLDLELRETFALGCYESADFISSYDVLYPMTAVPKANHWINKQAIEWVRRCKTAIQSKKLSEVTANRNILRASLWPEISCWTEEIISGYFNYSDSWSAPALGQAFTLDLTTGEPIGFDDLFPKNFDSKTWLQEYMKKESPKIPRFANDPEFREWLYREGFPLFTIRHKGIKLSTVFHPIYGQQHLEIPYESLKPVLKKDSPLIRFWEIH